MPDSVALGGYASGMSTKQRPDEVTGNRPLRIRTVGGVEGADGLGSVTPIRFLLKLE